MTLEKLNALLADRRRLVSALADPELLLLLPVTATTVAALPPQLAPFQARWLLGNCTDKVLAAFRELHPDIVVQKFGQGHGARYRYSTVEVCRAGAIPCDALKTFATSTRGVTG